VLSSKGKFFLKSLYFYHFQPVMGGGLLIPEIPSRHLFYCPIANYLISSHRPNLFRNHAFLYIGFDQLFMVFFDQTTSFSTGLFFLLPILTVNLDNSS
jgi:hypothetical protein